MKDRYVINKLGLVNFWYYDIEEFQLANGKLLLRGSNGSGKSVTMQSFIPLLLDGNKSPERLDPFGTKSRTITNYLLDEDTDERTGYLYIEFKRQSSDNYITIGMGVKAIKNKPPQSWYFIITDGRRVNKDLYLYRDAGELIPLTKKQLQNELGDVNFFTDVQGRYMEKVNEYLFGFDDTEAYEELLNLLISIRSPKLSKDFKPTEIYKILTDSLKVLSDDDLRPISDSLESMDSLKSSLEENEASIKAAQNIKRFYDKYNSYLLWEKASRYNQKQEELKENNKVIKKKEDRLKELLKRNQELTSSLEQLERGLKKAEETYDKLRSREELKFKAELIEIDKNLLDWQKDKGRKEEQLQEKRNKLNVIAANLRRAREELEGYKSKRQQCLKAMEDIAEEIFFEAGKGLEEVNLSSLELLIKEYEARLKEGIGLLKELEKQKEKVKEAIIESDRLEDDFKAGKADMRRIEELFSTEKENYKAALTALCSKNRELSLNEEERKELFAVVESVESPSNMHLIINKLNELRMRRENELNGNKHLDERCIEDFKSRISEIEAEIKELMEKKEIEPERSEGVIRNRERLIKEKIPFTPLYKAVDFNKGIDDKTRSRIEASLRDMGLIDALIIDERYREEALNFQEGMEDKYIFSKPNFMSFNLTSLLKLDKELSEKSLTKAVDEVLQSIFIEDNGEIFLKENGQYSFGIIRGKSSDSYTHKFIGESSRKKHKEQVIDAKRNEIKDLSEYISKLEKSIENTKARIEILGIEYKSLPDIGSINEALKLLEEQQRTLKQLDESIIKYKNIIFTLKEELENIKLRAYNKISGIQLSQSVEAYEEALDIISEYKDEIRNGKVIEEKIKGREQIILSEEDKEENLKADLDVLYYDLNVLSQSISKSEIRQEAIKAALEKTNIKEIEEELELCISIRDKNPSLINAANNELGSIKAEVKNLEEDINLKKGLSEVLKGEQDILENIFLEEYGLAYVLPKEAGTGAELCKKVLSTLGDTKNTNRETLSNELISSYNKNSGDLREYSIRIVTLFKGEQEDSYQSLRERTELRCRISGQDISFLTLIEVINKHIEELKLLISDEERRIFEEVLMNTVSVKIRSKIYQSKEWIDKINGIMEDMDTTSTLKLSLSWTPHKAEEEGQLNVSELIDIMSRGDRCTEEELKRLANHFTLKVKEALRSYEGSGEVRNYHSIIKEVLDYRRWYEFKLYYTKKNERRKELTNNEFFRFSGGEKAMSMYIPLFSALYARYKKARGECPRIISMDEAFAGVDEDNIRDMFRLLKKLDLDYILNSQILWGTYDTVEDLAICELIREDNDKLVTIIRYHWNGKEKVLME